MPKCEKPNCSCKNKEIPNNLVPLKMYEIEETGLFITLCDAAFAEYRMFADHLLSEYEVSKDYIYVRLVGGLYWHEYWKDDFDYLAVKYVKLVHCDTLTNGSYDVEFNAMPNRDESEIVTVVYECKLTVNRKRVSES